MSDYRILNNDPSYERINGQRKARSIGAIAGYIFWLGVVLLFIAIVVVFYQRYAVAYNLFIFAFIVFTAWLPVKMYSHYLSRKYVE